SIAALAELSAASNDGTSRALKPGVSALAILSASAALRVASQRLRSLAIEKSARSSIRQSFGFSFRDSRCLLPEAGRPDRRDGSRAPQRGPWPGAGAAHPDLPPAAR